MLLERRPQLLAAHVGQAGVILDLVGLADLLTQLFAAEQQQAFAPESGGDRRRDPRGAAADDGNIYTRHSVTLLWGKCRAAERAAAFSNSYNISIL